ncbi:hypothetical protein D918_02153 [Trichuris suis]|nr:hypothetical protein D918_02153 [Trichuris suis]
MRSAVLRQQYEEEEEETAISVYGTTKGIQTKTCQGRLNALCNPLSLFSSGFQAEANVESDDALVEKMKCSSKKSDENSADGEGNEMALEVPETSTEPQPPSQSKATFSPLQLLLDFYVRVFIKKDPDCYFTKPFSENDCKTIVNQTDIAAIQNKIALNNYKTLIELKSDLELVVSNVLKLNDFSTEYRVAARKFTLVIDYMFSKEKMLSLQRALPGMHRVTAEQLGFSETPKQLHCLRKGKTNRCPLVVDDLTDEEILCQAQTVSELAADLASSRAELACPKLNPNKRTTLKMLTSNKIYRRGDNVGSGGSAKVKRPVLLSDIVGQLKEGNPGLLTNCAEPRKEIPVTYLNYGPLSSFAPSYDSTWATLPKRETDFICSDSERLLANFSASHKLFASHHPECRVDLAEVFNASAKTQSKNVRSSAPAKPESSSEETLKDPFKIELSDTDYQHLKSLEANGIDMSFLDNMRKTNLNKTDSQSSSTVASLLAANSKLIKSVVHLQNARLSQPPPITITNVADPGEQELRVAGQLFSNLSALISQSPPGSIIGPKTAVLEKPRSDGSSHPLSEATTEADEYDMNVLREFLQVDA